MRAPWLFDDQPRVAPVPRNRSLLEGAGEAEDKRGPAPWTVEQFHRQVKSLVYGLTGQLRVRGVVQSLRVTRGSLTVVLVQSEDGVAQTKAATLTCWFFENRYLPWLRKVKAFTADFDPKSLEGNELTLIGRISYNGKSGAVALNLEDMDLSSSKAMADGRAQAMARLKADGTVERAMGKLWPALPRRLGLITGADSAAMNDVIRTLQQYPLPLQLVVFPTLVQGLDAPKQLIARAGQTRRLNLDGVIVSRGGGSQGDLSAFDSEAVARAFAENPVPLMAAVGHSVDQTLLEAVANQVAITPTAAAMFVARQWMDVLERPRNWRRQGMRIALERLTRGASALREQANRSLSDRLEKVKARLSAAGRALELLDPLRPLRTGLAVVTQGGRQVRSRGDFNPRIPFTLTFADGSVELPGGDG